MVLRGASRPPREHLAQPLDLLDMLANVPLGMSRIGCFSVTRLGFEECLNYSREPF